MSQNVTGRHKFRKKLSERQVLAIPHQATTYYVSRAIDLTSHLRPLLSFLFLLSPSPSVLSVLSVVSFPNSL